VILACIVAILAAGCSSLPPQPSSANSQTEALSAPAPSKVTGSRQARDGIAQQQHQMLAALTRLATEENYPTRSEIDASLQSIAKANRIEISADRTPTGLHPDAIEAAMLIGKTCLVGQIRAQAASVTILPILPTGHCLIGDQIE
jgi:hypothetical protein